MSTGPDKSLLYRYATNQCTPEEKIFVEEWVNSDEKLKLQLELVKTMLIASAEVEPTIESKDVNHPIPSFRNMKIIWYLLIAILVIVLLILKFNK